MKKLLSLIIAIIMMFAFSACSNSSQEGKIETTSAESAVSAQAAKENEENTSATDSKSLVAFFSRTGENYNVGVIEKGNTNIIADMIAEKTNSDIFEIKTVKSYPAEYEECTEVTKEEQKNNARPELAGSVENMEQYNTVYIGYPIWWGDMPMAVYTFLESYDFTGKTVIPFCTHQGSGLSGTIDSISKALPKAKVIENAFEIKGEVAQKQQSQAEKEVSDWLEEIEVLE